jgi:branched-chain amino acid transport system ATP-binding protein
MAHEPTTSPRPLLMASGLTKAFRGLMALKDHRIVVREREIVGVIGPNGSGKSTFFNLVTGFTRPDSGRVELDGRPIHRLRPSQIVRLGIARTFQGTRLFPQLTVRENVAAAAQLRQRVGLADALLGTGRLARVEAAVAAAVDELLDLLGLVDSSGRRAGDLAYGDQRRLELARALATGPRLLMLDEPAAGMDGTETRSLLRLIETVREHFGVAVVVVEHDMDLIMNLCERIQVLAHGELIFEGTPAEVQASPRVRETYLGQA